MFRISRSSWQLGYSEPAWPVYHFTVLQHAQGQGQGGPGHTHTSVEHLDTGHPLNTLSMQTQTQIQDTSLSCQSQLILMTVASILHDDPSTIWPGLPHLLCEPPAHEWSPHLPPLHYSNYFWMSAGQSMYSVYTIQYTMLNTGYASHVQCLCSLAVYSVTTAPTPAPLYIHRCFTSRPIVDMSVWCLPYTCIQIKHVIHK